MLILLGLGFNFYIEIYMEKHIDPNYDRLVLLG